MSKERIDRLLVQRGLAPSRAKARAWIEAGSVSVAGVLARSPAQLVDEAAALSVQPDHPYVSRGGLKLEGALVDLTLDPAGCSVADIGASTGGFTDCLLRRGARRVYAVDVGHGQLHPSLRADARVVVMEHVNARFMHRDSLPEPVELVVVDASFISLEKLLPALVQLLAPGGRLLALVKPQFELGPGQVDRHGVVRDDPKRRQALEVVVEAARQHRLTRLADADCRVPGPSGNREIFALFALA